VRRGGGAASGRWPGRWPAAAGVAARGVRIGAATIASSSSLAADAGAADM
jgi:hypothetical protein